MIFSLGDIEEPREARTVVGSSQDHGIRRDDEAAFV